MLFNSIEFIIFFLFVVAVYYLTTNKYRWFVLLVASYYFYMSWNPFYIILIAGSTVIDYLIALRISNTKEVLVKKKLLIISLLANLGLLFTFKYFNFLNQSLCQTFEYFGFNYSVPDLQILLPVGISFYTFQTLSYTIDVYRGDLKPEKHFGRFALFVTFFPQLVAGPIERASHFLPQFKNRIEFNYERIKEGLVIVLWGFFQKIVIADRLAIYVDAVYDNPDDFTGLRVWIASYFFAFQIFCDFSGYTDIARGCAKILGFDLMFNFNQPYLSRSVTEFWRRWHISLSTWFRDYLYFPLGGSKVKIGRVYFNLAIIFVVSGLWYGASWTFVIWGVIHALYMVSERFFMSELQISYLKKLIKLSKELEFELKIVRPFEREDFKNKDYSIYRNQVIDNEFEGYFEDIIYKPINEFYENNSHYLEPKKYGNNPLGL